MQRVILAAVACLCCGLALHVVPLSSPGSSAADAVGANVTLEPHTNDEYVSLTGDGEIALVVNGSTAGATGVGVNDDATTTIDDVLLVTNEGENVTSVWTGNGTDGLRVFRSVDGRPSLEGSANATVLEPNESAAVGVRIDTFDSDIENRSTLTFYAAHGDVTPDESGGVATSPSSPDATMEMQIWVVNVTSDPEGTTVRMAIEGIESGSRVTLDARSRSRPDGPLLALENTSVTSLAATSGLSGSFEVSLVGRTAKPRRPVATKGTDRDVTDPAAFARATDRRPAAFLRVTHPGGPTAFRDARIDFRVAARYLRAVGADPDGVALYRRTGGAWTALETARTDRRAASGIPAANGSLGYRARAPGLSLFAVGVRAPAVRVTDLSAARTDEGRLLVVATVTNNGTGTARQMAMAVNGTVAERRQVTLDAGSRRRVAFDVALEGSGPQAVSVGDQRVVVGKAPVDGRTEPEPSPDPDPPADDGLFPDGRLPLVVGGLALSLAAAAALWVVHRRR